MSLISDQIVRILLEDDVSAADQIEKNMGLVYSIAKDFYSNMPGERLDFDDLVSDGKIALIRALRGWNPEKGAFSTYATAVIKNDLIKTYQAQKEQSVEKAILDEPTDWEEEGGETGTSQVKDEDLASDMDTYLAKNDTAAALESALASIADPRIRACLNGMKNGRSYRDIASELGITQTYVADLTAKGLDQLRRFLVKTKKMAFNPATGMLEADEVLALPEIEARKKFDQIIRALKNRAAKLQRSAV